MYSKFIHFSPPSLLTLIGCGNIHRSTTILYECSHQIESKIVKVTECSYHLTARSSLACPQNSLLSHPLPQTQTQTQIQPQTQIQTDCKITFEQTEFDLSSLRGELQDLNHQVG
jgi:hypothetical protein